MSIRTPFNPMGTLGDIQILDSVFVPRRVSGGQYYIVGKAISAPTTNNYRSVAKFRDYTGNSMYTGILGTSGVIASQSSGFIFTGAGSSQLSLVQRAETIYQFRHDGKRIECTQIGSEIKLYLDGTLLQSFNIPAWENHNTGINVRQSGTFSYTFERLYVADGEQILVDLVPAGRHDGVLGIFDKVTRSFYEFSS